MNCTNKSNVAQFVRMIEARETHRRKESLASAEINPASVRQCRSKAFDEAEGSKSRFVPVVSWQI